MSFSFNVRAATKDAAKAQIADKLRDIVNQQPVHEADREAIQNAADAYLELVTPADDHDFNIIVSGSVGTISEETIAVSLNISASRVARPADET